MRRRRMDEVREREQRATLEELMYICVLEKFVTIGVQMMPRIDVQLEQPSGSIKALTEASTLPRSERERLLTGGLGGR